MDEMKTWIIEHWKDQKFRFATVLLMGAMLGLCIEFYLFGYSVLKSIRYLYLLIWLYALAWIDEERKIVPNKILTLLLISRAVLLLPECLIYREYWLSILLSAFLGGILGGGMFLLCYAITRGGIGAGDVKLFGVLGLYLGSGAIFSAIFLTVVYAAAYNIVRLLRKKTNLKQEIPFVPFIFLGTITTIILGV